MNMAPLCEYYARNDIGLTFFPPFPDFRYSLIRWTLIYIFKYRTAGGHIVLNGRIIKGRCVWLHYWPLGERSLQDKIKKSITFSCRVCCPEGSDIWKVCCPLQTVNYIKQPSIYWMMDHSENGPYSLRNEGQLTNFGKIGACCCGRWSGRWGRALLIYYINQYFKTIFAHILGLKTKIARNNYRKREVQSVRGNNK